MRGAPSFSAVVAMILAAGILAACETVPYTGRSQLQLISPQEESQMGAQAFQDIVGKAKLSNDVAASEMVTRVGKRIAAASGHPEYQWEYRLIQDDKQVNAFALPGGKVAVYTGILPVTKDENGLAAVLGHEIGHVVARHGGERISQQMGVNVVVETLAGLSSGNPAVVQSVSALLGAGASVGVLLPWGRAQESEADHLGLILMAKAGYDPHAARDLWVRMAELSKGSGKPPEFLSTHPSEATRVTQIEAWMPEAMQYYKPR
ncbi:MAG TPA: M48 family metallopeptidase [Terriglobales bacterium]|nr:M48 family metallopeptidase [Terriglobales bacterium]